MKDQNAPSAVAGAGSWWLYPVLFTLQTIGAVILYWNALPNFREGIADPKSFQPLPNVEAWALPAIALVQVAYWTRCRFRPALPRFQNAFAGQVVLFIAQLSFTLPAAIFAVFFISGLAKPVSTSRYLVIIATLFSVFCYMRELQHLGNALIGDQARPRDFSSRDNKSQ